MACPASVKAVLRVVAIVIVAIACSAVVSAETFDKPVRETFLDLGSSPNQPDFPNLHVHLFCYYFSDFMVKELTDDGNKGALRISITRLQQTQVPACKRINSRGEIVISDEWDYYWGVKGGLVILIGADGLSGGMNFDVFDSKSGRKIFKDNVLLLDPKEELNFVRNVDGRLSLMYQRFFAGPCSVPQGGASCWARFQKIPGLKDAPMPKCSGYQQLDPRYRDDPSVISYPVEVNLFPRPTTKVLSKAPKCWAAD